MKIIDGKKRGKKSNEHEEELFQFDENEEEDDDDEADYDDGDNQLSASDIEDEQPDDIPDQKAWGKKRGQYYDADFIDKDYSTYTQEEEELALAEEQEAQEIQKRLAQELNDIDCDLELFGITKKEDLPTSKKETKLKADFSNLDSRQKLQLFKKESPEFEGLISDFEHNLNQLNKFFSPLLEYAKINKSKLPIFKVLQARVSATHFYITNLAFYLYMKAKKVQFKGHPIVKKLAQIKQLLTELDNKIEDCKPQLDELLEKINEGEEIICVPTTKSKLTRENHKDDEDLENEIELESVEGEGVVDEADRRGITYQIAKNKGLTPYRKKENRNPRVKHRGKFRKALIRRKGAVRTVRKETRRYDGEISGIKASVTKSIKIK